MTITTDSFGINHLTSQRRIGACPVNGCNEDPTQNGKVKVCTKHGLEIRKSTFVYYNGNSYEDKKTARSRNLLPFGRDFAKTHIFDNKHKAESYRFGYENSEDALTWNIFGGLLYHGRLNRVYEYLTGQNASHDSIELFLWGLKIDFNDNQQPKTWKTLLEVRDVLEPRKEIRTFPTEPDIMILGPSHLVCIEAKFKSGNPIAFNKEVADGEKPKSRNELIKRYVRPVQINDKQIKPVIKPEHVGETVHSQLLRMFVFTSTIAQLVRRPNWIVANLVSNTQWSNKKNSCEYDFENPTSSIPACVRNNFRFISWEKDIYRNILKAHSLDELTKYMENKTANLKKAFDLSDSD